MNYKQEIINDIKTLGAVHGISNVFSDFLAMSAISISNICDKSRFDEREAEYMQIIKKYKYKELERFPAMLGNLMMELNTYSEKPKDVLGVIFHDLQLHNVFNGQFFTPQHVSELMAMLALGDQCREIEDNGYITVNEPCVGSGSMLLAFAGALAEKGYKYSESMRAYAMDIDIKCVHMAYIQLSLYGIPAVVVHGNTLTMEEWSHWYTPTMVWYKLKNNIINKELVKGE